jgi:DNA-binding response OmpR family regulator
MAHEITILSESQRLRDVLRAALEDRAYHVSWSSIASFELGALAALRPDLIILDWYLGLEDQGLQALQSLKLYAPLAELPVIICSAPTVLIRGMRDQLERANTYLLCKPFGLGELHGAVEAALAGARIAALDSRIAPSPRWLRRIAPPEADERVLAGLSGADGADAEPPDTVAWPALAGDGLSVS